MRKRSKALTTLAAFGLIGGAIAGTAGASAPPDTGGGGGEHRRRRRRPRQRQRHRGCRLLRHHRHRVRPGELGADVRRHDHRPRRVRRVERHPHRLHRRPRLRGADQRPGRERATRPTSPSSRSPASSPASPAPATCSPLPDDVLANVSANWAPDVDVVRQRRRHPVRHPDQDRHQVARVVHPVDVRRVRLHRADHARRVLRPHRPDDRRRPHPAVRRHRVRARPPGGRSPTGSRSWCCATRASTTTTSGWQPRDAVQRPADRRGDADRGRPVGQARRGVRRRRHDRGDAVPEPTPSRCSTATA